MRMDLPAEIYIHKANMDLVNRYRKAWPNSLETKYKNAIFWVDLCWPGHQLVELVVD